MTMSERNALSAIFAAAGRLLRENPVDTVEPDPVDTVEDTEPDTVDPVDESVTIVAAGDDVRYATKAQRGLIAHLSDSDYIASGELRRQMAKAVIEALLNGDTVELPAIGVTLTPDPTAIEARNQAA